MAAQAVDYSFSHPSPEAIKNAGFVGVLRYLSREQAPKDLLSAERDQLHAVGLQIGVVFETTANRASQGFQAGSEDAQKANTHAANLGWPIDRPIYYAVDFQANWNTVKPYFDGVASVHGRPHGVYGCYDVVEGAGRTGIHWLWQCAAWSGNGTGSGGTIQSRRLSKYALLFQRVGYALGNTADVNDCLADDWGGYHPDTHTTPPVQEEDMPAYIQRTSNGDPHVIFPSGLRVNFATVDGVTGENQIKLIKYVGIGGQPCEERPAVTSPDADFLITRVFTEASTVQGSQAMTKLILDAISKVDGGPSAPTDVQAVAEAVANELAQRLES